MKKTTKEIGDKLEEKVARLLGGKKHKQSGGGNFLKLDVGDSALVISCKATEKDKITVTSEMILEAKRGAAGPRGKGNYIPALAIGLDDSEVVLLALNIEDYQAMMTKEIIPYIEPTKQQERRSRLSRSIL